MRTFVTGATGFLGRRLVAELVARGDETKVLVRDPKQASEFRDRGVEVLVGDFRESATLRSGVSGADVVYHCASAPSERGTERAARDANVAAARELLEAVRKQGRGRVVLLSSPRVWGMRNLDPATEDTPTRASSEPGFAAKLAIERLGGEYHGRHGVDVTLVRPGFIHGPGDPKNVPRLLKAIERGKFAFIGSRDNVIPIVHVDDLVRALLLMGQAACARGRVYNIMDGSRTTIGAFVARLAAFLGVPEPRKVLPYGLVRWACGVWEIGGRVLPLGAPPIARDGLLFLGRSRFVDIRRAREELGFVPQFVFPEGLAATLQWIAEQSHGTTDVPVSAV